MRTRTGSWNPAPRIMSFPALRVRLTAITARSWGNSKGRFTSSSIPHPRPPPLRFSKLATAGSNPISIPVPEANRWRFSINPGSGAVTRMWERGCQTSRGNMEPTLPWGSYSRTKTAHRTCQCATPKDSERAVTSWVSSSRDSGSFSRNSLSRSAQSSMLAKGCRRRRWRSHLFWTFENSELASKAWNRSSTSRVYLSVVFDVPSGAVSTTYPHHHIQNYHLFETLLHLMVLSFED